ncbi:MAG: glycine betaine ABC transporter substrate-binding protein, partial [Cellulomonadaceae bacterium]
MTHARRTFTGRRAAAATAALALGLGLAACGSDDGGSGADDKNVSIGIPSGWDEGIAASYLWAAILEDEGY